MKICLQGLVRNAKNDLRNRANLSRVKDVVEGLQDIIVALLKGDVTHEQAKEFLFNSNNPIEKVEYYQSLITITPEEGK